MVGRILGSVKGRMYYGINTRIPNLRACGRMTPYQVIMKIFLDQTVDDTMRKRKR